MWRATLLRDICPCSWYSGLYSQRPARTHTGRADPVHPLASVVASWLWQAVLTPTGDTCTASAPATAMPDCLRPSCHEQMPPESTHLKVHI